MSIVLTDTLGFSAYISQNPGATDATGPDVGDVLITDLTRFGGTPSQTAHNPISNARQNFKGKNTGFAAGMGFDARFHLDLARRFLPAFCYAKPVNSELSNVVPTAVTNGATQGFTVPALASAPAEGTLLWVSGFTADANNGLKVVGSGSTTTSIRATDASFASSGSATAFVPVAQNERNGNERIFPGGFRASGTGKTWTYAMGVGTLTLAAGTTVPGLVKGMRPDLGSVRKDGTLQNTLLDTNGDPVCGSGRVISVNGNVIQFDHLDEALQNNDHTVGTNLDLRYGEFVKNVARNDPLFQEYWVIGERYLANLANDDAASQGFISNDRYKYVLDNRPNTFAIGLATDDLATVSASFDGRSTTDELAPGAVNQRPAGKRGFEKSMAPLQTDVIATNSGVPRIRFGQDQDGVLIDVISATLNIDNQVTASNVIGFRGSKNLFYGNFLTNMTAEVSYSDPDIAGFVNKGTELSWDMTMVSDDGWLAIDVPAVVLASDGETHTRGGQVTLSGTSNAHRSPIFGCSSQYTICYGDRPTVGD